MVKVKMSRECKFIVDRPFVAILPLLLDNIRGNTLLGLRQHQRDSQK